MLEKLRNIMWFDWMIIVGIGLLLLGLGFSWKTENKGKIEILVKEIEDVEVFKENNILGIESNESKMVKTDSISKSISNDSVKNSIAKGKININKAGVEELTKLSGIGPKTAEKIIEYRTINKGFMDIKEIKLVKGIGDKMYEKIKDNLEI